MEIISIAAATSLGITVADIIPMAAATSLGVTAAELFTKYYKDKKRIENNGLDEGTGRTNADENQDVLRLGFSVWYIA